ncbi:hypothetical protein [Nonomuraea dietziae]|uniref:hypothetical protein n=1 Tax=Nonomuraea dietziae TaxID=65515 RepID=UPI0031E2AD53
MTLVAVASLWSWSSDDLHWAGRRVVLKLLRVRPRSTRWFERSAADRHLSRRGVSSRASIPLGSCCCPPWPRAGSTRGDHAHAPRRAREVARAGHPHVSATGPTTTCPGDPCAAQGATRSFVEQTARLWRRAVRLVRRIPPGVRDTLWRRLSLLPAPVVKLLTESGRARA